MPFCWCSGSSIGQLKEGLLLINKISSLVLGEADEMSDMGFMEQVQNIMTIYRKNSDRAFFKIGPSKENTLKLLHSYINAEDTSNEKLLLDLLTVENADA